MFYINGVMLSLCHGWTERHLFSILRFCPSLFKPEVYSTLSYQWVSIHVQGVVWRSSVVSAPKVGPRFESRPVILGGLSDEDKPHCYPFHAKLVLNLTLAPSWV